MSKKIIEYTITDITHVVRSVVGLIAVIALGLIIRQALVNFTYIKQQDLKNQAIYDCGVVSGTAATTASGSATVSTNVKQFYKTCIEDKGYNSGL